MAEVLNSYYVEPEKYEDEDEEDTTIYSESNLEGYSDLLTILTI